MEVVVRIRYVLFNAYAAGGTSRTVITQANELCSEHDVEIASVYRHRERPHFTIDPRITLRPLTDLQSDGIRRQAPPGARPRRLARARRLRTPLSHRFDFRFRRWDPAVDLALVRYLVSIRDGVVVTTRPGLNLLASRFVRRSVVRVAQEHMNLASHKPGLRNAIARSYRRLDCVVTLTDGDARDYAEVLAGTPVRVAHIPNSVPVPTSPPARLDAPVLVSAGRLGHQKGFDLLLDAFALVLDQHPEWELRIFGGGEKKTELEGRIEVLGLQGRVHLPGVTPAMQARLAEASVYVMSSRYEGFPMVLLEAMSVGLPVVSFDCPTGPAEIITHGCDGLLVPPDDAPGLAAAICQMIEDPARRRSAGAAALESSRRYRANAVRPVWEGLFRDLLAAKGAT